MLKVSENNSKDREFIHKIKHNIEIEQSYAQLDLKCYGCKQKGHVVKFCAQIHIFAEKYSKVELIRRIKNEKL